MNTKATMPLRLCAGAAAVLLLAGCSATHVGESWQCPLAQGTSCATIAEADPAVPAGAARPAVLFGEPLHGARHPVGGAAPRERAEACHRECGPLAWLTGLFRGGTGDNPAALPTKAHAPVTPAGSAAGPGGTAVSTSPSAAPEPVEDASLRVPEVLGRIWIAPFVDQDGIYREAHWVRVVLEPAGWKLP